MVRVDKPCLLISDIGISWILFLGFQGGMATDFVAFSLIADDTPGMFQNDTTLSLLMTHSAKAGMVAFSAPSKKG